MLEEILVTARHNPKIDPFLDIWTWEISVYLFLGGLTAGIMFFSALMNLMQKGQEAPFARNQLALWAPVVLSVGMATLFLDLEHKLYVFRFYTTFEPTSPMSWGAWILIFIYPIAVLQILSTFRRGYPFLASYVDRSAIGRWVLDVTARFRKAFAVVSIPFAVALGIYTGILLSAFSARPFWNTGILGPLFLVSGFSTAAAFALLFARERAEKHLFTRIDLGLIATELVIVALWLINLGTGAQPQLDAVQQILGGEYTVMFWGFFVVLGLVIPLVLEVIELGGSVRALAVLGPVLVLVGGYVLRHVTVEAGQVTSWIDYESEFNTQLLQRLTREPGSPEIIE
jgi:protein NrfD